MAHRGLYKRNGVWQIRYSLNGKIVRKSADTTNFKEAEGKLRAIKTLIDVGKEPETKKIGNHTFDELAERYKAWITGRQRSAEVKGYIIDKLTAKYGTLPLRRFNMNLAEQLQTELMSKGLNDDSKKGLKAASNNKVMNVFKHLFTKAVEWDMVEADTLKRIRKVKLFKEPKRLRFLSIEEAQGLISVCEPHLQPIVITALHTGMRRGEILGLKWENVDLQHGFILLSETNNDERREIPIDETLKKTLHSLPHRIDTPYVFHDPRTLKPYQDVKRSFHTALERAGITDFHFHDLRHTFASHLVMAGVDLTAVKELLGHKDIKMTLRYAHLAPAHKRKAVNVMDRLLTERNSTDTKLTHMEETGLENEVVYVRESLKY